MSFAARFFRVGSLVAIAGLHLSLSACQGGFGRDDGRVTIVFWHSFVSSTIPALEDLIDRFEEEHPHIRIKAQYIPTGDALVQKLITAMQSRKAPDISWIHSHYVGDLVQADAIYEMQPFIEGPNGIAQEDLDDMYPALRQYASWQGTLYSMPMEATNLGILYNKDLFREAGLDPESPPSTWDELREAARRLTVDRNQDGRPEQIGFMVPIVPADGPQGAYMMWQWIPFLWQAGGYLINEEQTKVLFDEPAGVEALTLWKELYDMQMQRNFSNDALVSFSSKQVAMILDGPWNIPRYPRILGDIDYGIAWLPAGPVKRATVVAGEYLAIFKQSKHPDEAWEFLKWMIRPDVQADWSVASGYLPVRPAAMEVESFLAFLASHPQQRAFVEQMQYAQAQRPMDFRAVEIQRLLAIALEQACVGGRDPATVLRDAAEKSNALLDAAKRPAP